MQYLLQTTGVLNLSLLLGSIKLHILFRAHAVLICIVFFSAYFKLNLVSTVLVLDVAESNIHIYKYRDLLLVACN